MKIENLARGNELQKLISTTSSVLNQLKKLRDTVKKRPAVRGSGNLKSDNLYNLYIGQYQDDPDTPALARYEGNDELLDVIIETLTKQVANFTTEFASL